ncbi:hypothetical protein [Proteiniphilum sp. X52]|uniref:hypothetical protein n=1 Tax=Proteiniphilum sp. X52 TaxID=2382159 RepID=UPI001313F92B|nr:hypothetical protein [Proteiniphilum sp. X52]
MINYITFENVNGVKREFENKEGFAKIDGSNGIELMTIWGYEFDEKLLDMTVITD